MTKLSCVGTVCSTAPCTLCGTEPSTSNDLIGTRAIGIFFCLNFLNIPPSFIMYFFPVFSSLCYFSYFFRFFFFLLYLFFQSFFFHISSYFLPLFSFTSDIKFKEASLTLGTLYNKHHTPNCAPFIDTQLLRQILPYIL